MLGKEQLRTISIVIAVILLTLAVMFGILNKSDDKLELKQVQSEYNDFKTVVDSLSENNKKLTDGKAEYDAEKNPITRINPLTRRRSPIAIPERQSSTRMS